MTVIRVDEEDLRAAARQISAAGSIVAGSYRAQAAELVPGGGQAGWSATATLGVAVGAWGPYLGGLHESVEASATGLRAAADAYVAADWEAADRHRRGGGGFFE